jgi:hypothetical protein
MVGFVGARDHAVATEAYIIREFNDMGRGCQITAVQLEQQHLKGKE